MIKFKNLSIKNYFSLKKMCEKSKEFNRLNDSIKDNYEGSTLLALLLSNQNVSLMKYHNEFIGYVWYENIYEDIYMIRDLYMSDRGFDKVDSISIKNKHFLYESYTSSNCNKFLTKFNFFEKDVSDLLILPLDKINISDDEEGSDYEVFQRDNHEKIRCELQNNIFGSDSRIPLTLDDVYFDEEQAYYIENACIFLKENDIYIGMGQIINLNNKLTIVNFGIRKEYRKKGYGKKLINRLLLLGKDIGKAFGKKEIYIRVSRENTIAYGLYIDSDFTYVDSIINWEI